MDLDSLALEIKLGHAISHGDRYEQFVPDSDLVSDWHISDDGKTLTINYISI